MLDFLKFNTFITQDVLVFIYYIGAFALPILLWKYGSPLLYKFFKLKNARGKKLAFITLFFCIELCWRMFFEAMIGYFDMHEYLYKISQTVGN